MRYRKTANCTKIYKGKKIVESHERQLPLGTRHIVDEKQYPVIIKPKSSKLCYFSYDAKTYVFFQRKSNK